MREQKNQASHFDLDLNHLDVQLAEQAKLMYQYSQQLAEARLELNRNKRRSEYFSAKIKQEIRRNPEAYTSVKVTEECLKELLVLQSRYQSVQRDLEQAQYQVDLLNGMVASLTDRKHVLQADLQLWSQGYFAEPRLPASVQHAVDEHNKEIRNRRNQP